MRGMKPGQYIPGTSLIHQLDPRTKILGVLAVITAILVNPSWPVLILNALLIIVVIYLAEINPATVLRGGKWLWIIFIMSFLAQCLCVKGHPLFVLGPLAVTEEGVDRGLATFLRLFILFLSSAVLTMTTSPVKLAGGLEALLAPLTHFGIPVNKFAMLVTIALRFVPTLLEEAETITRAQKSRGAPFASPKKMVRLRTNLAVLIPLVAGALQRATDLAVAMESRCYTGEFHYSRVKKLRFRRRDLLSLTITAMVCILPLVFISAGR